MVSAESLNFDVLDLIFSYLSGHDLASIALVSRSFLAGVLPTLYKNMWYRLREGKGYISGQIMSPFSVILKHPNLAGHVRSIDVESVPSTTSTGIKRQPHPTFIRECTKALVLCKSILAFKCTVPNVLPSFLLALQNRPRMRSLRIYANLTAEQTRLLINISEVSNLELQFASWNVVHELPKWTTTLKSSLCSLTLYMTTGLSLETLEAVLQQVPQLQGLHIISCAGVDHIAVLKGLKHTPDLESLSFTTTENAAILPPAATLQNLHTLCIDARWVRANSSVPSNLQSILDYFKSSMCHLSSFSLKLPERRSTIGHPFVSKLLSIYGPSLKRLAFIDCGLEIESFRAIGKQCIQLERLTVAIPAKEPYVFADTISSFKTLKTLVHAMDNQHVHGLRPPLNQESVEYILERVRSLQTVVSDRRVWVRKDLGHGYVHAKIERRLPAGPRSLWFLPSNKF